MKNQDFRHVETGAGWSRRTYGWSLTPLGLIVTIELILINLSFSTLRSARGHPPSFESVLTAISVANDPLTEVPPIGMKSLEVLV